jgi:cell division septal protein FtsQ
MARKYIKNCTGEDCESERSHSNIVSKIIFYTLLLCFVGVLFYVLFFSQCLQVSNITVAGTQELDNEELQQLVEQSLEGKYLRVIPKNNFLFVSQKKVEGLLIGNFKKIRHVSVIKKFPDTVEIGIDERRALLVWCANEKCYLLDEQGAAYSEADFSSPELMQNNLLQINDTSGLAVTIGSQVIQPAYEQYVLRLKDSLASVGFEVTGQYYTPSRMAEEINAKTTEETEFYFSTQYPLESAMKTLTTIFKKEIAENKKGELAYVDLRNENKAFYKFKSIEPIPENSENANVDEKNKEQ